VTKREIQADIEGISRAIQAAEAISVAIAPETNKIVVTSFEFS
jgi:hypothetical protein